MEIVGHTHETGQFLWTNGHKFDRPLSTQVLELGSAYGTELADFFDTTVPVMSDRLIAAFHSAGVDNFDQYSVVLERKDTGETFAGYKAVNFIGCVDAVDLDKSEYELDSVGEPYFFEKIVLDPTKIGDLKAFRLESGTELLVVTEDVANHLLKGEFKALLLQPVEDFDGD